MLGGSPQNKTQSYVISVGSGNHKHLWGNSHDVRRRCRDQVNLSELSCPKVPSLRPLCLFGNESLDFLLSVDPAGVFCIGSTQSGQLVFGRVAQAAPGGLCRLPGLQRGAGGTRGTRGVATGAGHAAAEAAAARPGAHFRRCPVCGLGERGNTSRPNMVSLGE